ncbi:hypothetical protein KFL_005690010 [Klebsormidium nitens]|uniref:Reverse transcriptase domain-containing protein n=1 Tax=Klebsormidium nitens TaxID=105231 RepID=A0A1Y1IM32_KLENI|nr:hypothetical protein KFL_005690010 [Klebsormidium nitens]|eukprot:GAQ89846.1 hypothetical protein KFL_005690010 [Klebsormidium nitens]
MVIDQTLRKEIRGPKPCVTQYLDDTLLYSDDFAEHLSALDNVLTQLEAIDLKLFKCHFGASETEHLGHLTRRNQLLPTPEKVRAIRDWYEPINPTEIKSFLEMLGYYRISVPMQVPTAGKAAYELTKIGVPFDWGPHQAESFKLLKQALIDAQAFTRPDFAKPFKPFLPDTDYSKLVRVDHNPLVWLHQQTGLTGRLARWHCKLLEFNFTVISHPGRLHSNVDPLSRNLVATLLWDQDEDPDELPSYATSDSEYPPSLPQVSLCEVPTETPAWAPTVLDQEKMVEQLTRDMDRHLGWDAQQILEAATREGEAELPKTKGFDADVPQVLIRRRNFMRNGVLNTPLAENTLVERVAITILTSCPTADPEGVLSEAKKAILNMQQDCRENVVVAVRENLLAREGQNPSEGIKVNPDEASAA